ncbi:MAG: hypothetical protein HYW07_21870 [Candidatus Latescibacteria bacterium]|nr:hypothetical protein [Candidatus Latescibacterota bacterium]
MVKWIGILGGWLLAGQVLAQGHRLVGDQVVVDSGRQWQNWQYAPGTLEFTADGAVRAHRLRKDIDATADIVDYLRLYTPSALAKKKPEEITLLDAVQAGSNRQGVPLALDGDPATYWEPTPPSEGVDLATQWWFVVDLGRFVFARKIVLKFVDEELGDPFLLFDVLVSDGTKPARVVGATSPEYKTVLRMLQPNKSQRLFEIDLQGEDPEVQGEGLRLVQVVVTGSDFSRGRQVAQGEYAALAAGDQGAVEYYKRLADGREIQVDQDIYQDLPAQRQGSIHYFRGERPRLAELEVWTEGDEILSGTLARGGTASAPLQTLSLGGFIDGDLESFSQPFVGVVSLGAENDREIFFDLGSFFWIDSQRLAYGPFRTSFGDYHLEFSDGSRAADGSLKWEVAVERKQTLRGGVRFEANRFDPVRARFFRLKWTLYGTGTGSGGGGATIQLSEIQLYGEGVQPEVVLESDLIRLGGSRNLLNIAWDVQIPPGTQVLIQTRTGDQLAEVQHYFKKDGTEVSEAEYKKLLSVFKGEVTAEEVPGNDWSDWSEPYADPAGSPITSPSPREFLKVRATLRSADPEASAELRALHLRFADPVAQSLVGEVSPVLVDTLGSERGFSLYVRPSFSLTDPGFDQLLLVAPPDMHLEYAGLYRGAEDQMAGVEGVARVPTAGDSLLLSFPLIGPAAGAELVRLDFRTALYSTGVVLQAALQHRDSGAWQRVDPGDASPAIAGNTTTLVGAFRSEALIDEVQVEPALFTPNGDGINEQAVFRFKVVRVGDNSPIQVRLYDLGGRLVRVLAEQRSLSTGLYAIGWDGRDAEGRLVSPGVYCARLSIDTEVEGARVGRENILKVVSLAY